MTTGDLAPVQRVPAEHARWPAAAPQGAILPPARSPTPSGGTRSPVARGPGTGHGPGSPIIVVSWTTPGLMVLGPRVVARHWAGCTIVTMSCLPTGCTLCLYAYSQSFAKL